MNIAGLQKLTLVDYPEKTAATLFTPGCNFRCPFCHNASLVFEPAHTKDSPLPSNQKSEDALPSFTVEEVLAFLTTRKGLLEGVCITGGEPLLQKDLADFCFRVKQEGFAIKLDTNGSVPHGLRALVSEQLVDYVALDVKNSPAQYAQTIGLSHFDRAGVQESIDFLLEGNVAYEFRTTVVQEFHSQQSLIDLAQWITGAHAWYLQGFVDSEQVLTGKGSLHAYTADELRAFLPFLQPFVPAVELRGQ